MAARDDYNGGVECSRSHVISFNRQGSHQMMDNFGRLWQEALWDDDLRAMNPDDLVCNPERHSPRRVYFRVDAPNAPCITPFRADSSPTEGASPPQERNIAACHLEVSAFLRAILGRDVPKIATLAICFFLPVKERRAFSCLATFFRTATTPAWSEDLSANEQTLLAILRKDQPEFLSKAITDSGMCKASLGKVLLQATVEGTMYRRHRCCRLLGEMGAVIRPEDAVMVADGEPGTGELYVRRETQRSRICYVGPDATMRLEEATADLVKSMEMFEDSVRETAKARQEPFWCHFDDGGYNFGHVAFSSCTVPPQAGWHGGEYGGHIQTRPLDLGDLLYSGRKSCGPILDESEVRKAQESLYSLDIRTMSFPLPPQWIPEGARIPTCDRI